MNKYTKKEFNKNLKIFVPKKRNRHDSFFYSTGNETFSVERSDGYVFSVQCHGEKQVTFTHNKVDYELRGDNCFYETIDKLKIDDKKLNRWSKNGKMYWIHNNWFEVRIYKSDESVRVVDDMAYTYDEAMEMLLESYQTYKVGDED